MKVLLHNPQILNPLSQFSHSVASDSLWPHESQHARPPCPSPSPGVHSDSCPSSKWCHPAILSSVAPFCSCPQSLPASESFPMSHLLWWPTNVYTWPETLLWASESYPLVYLAVWLESSTVISTSVVGRWNWGLSSPIHWVIEVETHGFKLL